MIIIKNLLKDIMLTGLGLLVVSKEKAEEIIENLVEQGDITRQEGKELWQEYLKRTSEGGEKLFNRINQEIEKRLSQAGFVTKNEYEKLQLQVDELRKELAELQESKSEGN